MPVYKALQAFGGVQSCAGDLILYLESHKIKQAMNLLTIHGSEGAFWSWSVHLSTIRCRLALASSELLSTNKRIIDIALKYGYEALKLF